MTASTVTLPAGLTTGTYVIDPSHSEIGFTARHAMVTKVRGRFTEVEGSLVIGEDADATSAEATIQTSSVTTGAPDRDAHLRSGDFFDVEQFPTIAFRSTGVRQAGDDHVLEGDLTIKDVTKPVTLKVEFGGAATDPFGNARVGFSAETDVEREDWGLTWNAALEAGGVLVSKKIKLTLDVSAIKQA